MSVGALLGAGTSLVGAMMQARAQREALNLQYKNLYEQQRQARERERMSKATREDAMGNRVEYIEGLGFKTKPTALTSSILNAQQKEQLEQFRTDAPRNRAHAERMDKRSQQASDVFDEKFNKYRYGRQRSRAEFEAEAVRDAIAARRGSKGNNNGELMNAISTAALRTGNSGALQSLLKSAREQDASTQTLAQAIAEAKKLGRQQYHAETQAENATTFGELGQLRSIADAIGNGQMNWNNENAVLTGQSNNALSNLIATNAANSSAVGGAYNNAANQAAKSFVNLGPLAQSLSKLQAPKRKQQQPSAYKGNSSFF